MQCLRVIGLLSLLAFVSGQETLTTASGTRAPARGSFESGDLIFEDNFEELDFETWQHEQTLAGGGNWEFQWYGNNRSNSYVENNTLHIVPTLVADEFGAGFLTSGVINVNGGTPADHCTDPQYWGCERQGTPVNVVNPVKSTRVRTVHSFAFKYGTLEIRAKIPAGDWLWPAIWLMPKVNAYGGWPSSGEIDLMESRGNRGLFDGAVNVGNERVGSTLHFGPRWDTNGWPTAHHNVNQQPAFSEGFHNYKMVWTNESITFMVDDEVYGVVNGGEGFWARGGFEQTNRDNPWKHSPNLMAPFDQEFYLIINLAIGGTNFFNDNLRNEGSRKPWSNNSPRAASDFWEGRSGWLPTWNMETDDSHLQIEHVRVWAL